ncbi:ee6ffeed-957a-42ca-92b2-3b8ddbd591de [Sclerotinia trifoliorum]|uniref:Ee6ffeed-957a-42ca-92b2-3b8ddbd591de n=1 Tax=Sclerotinia trifoliorum TaxID=28548 RepID=A0A8H2W3F7_9HELO|nr:ee6ffeed-957a-42ca-92b2-3b8ddbd591de [Sclerotinia trifoliorum]
MNSDSEYDRLLVRFVGPGNQVTRRPLSKFAMMEGEDSIQMSLLSPPTLSEHKSTSQNHHWDVIPEWNRLSKGRDEFRDFNDQQENIEELENDQDELTSELEKSSQVQDDVQGTGQKTDPNFPRLRRSNITFQRQHIIITCVIICGLVLFILIRTPDVGLLQYSQYLFEDLLTLFVFPIDGL